MSTSDLLAKLKGYSRPFVVHSNANPYAAVAAIGAAVGRSQRLKPYFNMLPKPSPGVQAQNAKAHDLASSGDKIDFIRDWSDFLRQTGLATCGLAYIQSRSPEDNTMRYLCAHRRIPITAPRTVHEPRGWSSPQGYEDDYAELKRLMISGEDLKPYLSHQIKRKRADKNDGLLNSEGIQHLHFRSRGTKDILLCKITDTDVFVIKALPHCDGDDEWKVDTSLLSILHHNWPEEIAAGKCHGLKEEAKPSSERLALRNHNANFVTTVEDGTVYLAPGSGRMASGDCFDDRRDCDRIFAELAGWQGVVKNNVARFCAAPNWPRSKELCIRMRFDHRDCWLYEPTTGRAIALTIQE